MLNNEQLARRLLRRLAEYGAPNGPTSIEASEALHSLGSIVGTFKNERLAVDAKATILSVIRRRGEVPTPPEVLEGAVKGAAALGTDEAGLALNSVVWSDVPASIVCEALKGIAKIIPRSGENVRAQLLKSLERALLTHSSGNVRALAA